VDGGTDRAVVTNNLSSLMVLAPICLHCALSLAAQCIVIGPVCGFVFVFVTTITRNCVHRSSPNWVCR